MAAATTLAKSFLSVAASFPADPALKEQLEIKWGDDFGSPHETVLTKKFDKPVFVYGYPTGAKAFYMEPWPGRPEVSKSVDLLAPEGYGEITGGSERISDRALLLERIHRDRLPEEAFRWYIDLRRYGSVPHSGFGLGVERTVAALLRALVELDSGDEFVVYCGRTFKAPEWLEHENVRLRRMLFPSTWKLARVFWQQLRMPFVASGIRGNSGSKSPSYTCGISDISSFSCSFSISQQKPASIAPAAPSVCPTSALVELQGGGDLNVRAIALHSIESLSAVPVPWRLR